MELPGKRKAKEELHGHIERNMKVVDVILDVEDRKRWKWMICCGDSRQEQPKKGKNYP